MVKDLEKKQFLTYDEQITFLEEKKGLMISDKEYAKKILLKIGYFPLINGYKEVFNMIYNKNSPTSSGSEMNCRFEHKCS